MQAGRQTDRGNARQMFKYTDMHRQTERQTDIAKVQDGRKTKPTHRNGRFLFLGVKIWYKCDHLKKNERSKSMFSL